MFSSRSVQIAAVFSDVFGKAFPNLCRSLYNETKAEMFFSVFAVALLAEGVDRNVSVVVNKKGPPVSPSSRRAWIEIYSNRPPAQWAGVALLAEGVDRNALSLSALIASPTVALLAEGVDRNEVAAPAGHTPMVALLAEGVDRNCYGRFCNWLSGWVALLAEGVDRNLETRY